jgi:Protein of unknown function (DUF2844)
MPALQPTAGFRAACGGGILPPYAPSPFTFAPKLSFNNFYRNKPLPLGFATSKQLVHYPLVELGKKYMKNRPALAVPVAFKTGVALTALAVLALCLCITGSARAELGGNAATVQNDQQALKGTQQVVHGAGYDAYEIKTPAGASVREYVAQNGKVFAIGWSSPGHPDMRQLLGTYFEQYQQALQAPRHGRGPLSVHQPGLVVELGGHPRAFVGRVYVPGLLPAGVDPEKIR